MSSKNNNKKPVPNAVAVEKLLLLQKQILDAENNPPQYDKNTTARQLADRIIGLAKTCRDENGVLLQGEWHKQNEAAWREARALGLYQELWNLITVDHTKKK